MLSTPSPKRRGGGEECFVSCSPSPLRGGGWGEGFATKLPVFFVACGRWPRHSRSSFAHVTARGDHEESATWHGWDRGPGARGTSCRGERGRGWRRHDHHRRRHRYEGLQRRWRQGERCTTQSTVPLRPRRQGAPLHRRRPESLCPQGQPRNGRHQHGRRHRQEGLRRRRRRGHAGDDERTVRGHRHPGGRFIHCGSA